MVVDQTNFGLDKEMINKDVAKKLLADSRLKELEKLDDENILYRSGNIIFLYNKDYKEMIFYLTFKITSYRYFLKNVLQTTALWSDRGFKAVEGITKHVFFKYLLPETGIVISDSMQTPAGARYWRQKLSEALQKNKHINYIDFNTNKLLKITNYRSFKQIAEKHSAWGTQEEHKAKRFVISDQELKIKE